MRTLQPVFGSSTVLLAGVVTAAALGWGGGCGPPKGLPEQHPGNSGEDEAPGERVELPGHTQPAPGRMAQIAPAVCRPVVQVLVAPGDRVEAGQPLVKLDDRDALAEVRSRQADLAEAQKELARCQQEAGSSPLEVAEREAWVAVADARLALARAVLKKRTVSAAIGGVVTRLDVSLVQVTEAGEAAWGEIVDLGEMDVRCDVTPDQARRIGVGQTAAVIADADPHAKQEGRVSVVGIAADAETGNVPVLVRMSNPGDHWRCQQKVMVILSVRSEQRR